MKQEESKLVMGPYNTNIKCCNTMYGKIKKIVRITSMGWEQTKTMC